MEAYVVLEAVLADGSFQTILVLQDEYNNNPDDFVLCGAEVEKVGLATIQCDRSLPVVFRSE